LANHLGPPPAEGRPIVRPSHPYLANPAFDPMTSVGGIGDERH